MKAAWVEINGVCAVSSVWSLAHLHLFGFLLLVVFSRHQCSHSTEPSRFRCYSLQACLFTGSLIDEAKERRNGFGEPPSSGSRRWPSRGS